MMLLEPDRAQLESFVKTLFKYAGSDGFVSMRAFFDNGNKMFRISPTSLNGGLGFVVDVAEDDARRAANSAKGGVVFCPPIAVFANKDRAREQDLLRGLVLSVECDERPQEARDKLEQLLGPATVVVASGGDWIDPETGEVQPKLHLHWRLDQPVENKAALADLKTARDIAARLVGGDPSNKPVCHPIRWPGSWHRKGQPKLCRIVACNPEREIKLTDALAALQKASPAVSKGNGKGNGKDPSGTSNWGELIAAVLSAESYHEPLVRLAAKLITNGMHRDSAEALLRGWMEAAAGPRDERWQARYDDIPRAVTTAVEKYGKPPQPRRPSNRPVGKILPAARITARGAAEHHRNLRG